VSKPSDPVPSVPVPALPSGAEWIASFAQKLGVDAPSPEQFDELLRLAGVAAHSSERIAAPVACWLAASAGVSPAEALRVAEDMVSP
jgi:Domain of unknown function (DUF6457)